MTKRTVPPEWVAVIVRELYRVGFGVESIAHVTGLSELRTQSVVESFDEKEFLDRPYDRYGILLNFARSGGETFTLTHVEDEELRAQIISYRARLFVEDLEIEKITPIPKEELVRIFTNLPRVHEVLNKLLNVAVVYQQALRGPVEELQAIFRDLFKSR